MFKNPLKYQQGGQLNEQQQQMLAAFIDWLPKRVKEFQGMQPDAIVQALDGMSKTPEGQKQVQQLMEQFQQESQSVPSAKRGGKIQDFICKHGRGGAVAGCGCEKHVEKAQGGTSMPYTRGSYQPSDYFNNTGTWIDTPNGLAQNYRPYTFGGRTWGLGGNDLEQILVVPGEYGTPRRAVRRISNWFNPDVPTERLDTTYQDANGNRRNSAEFEARVNRELEGVSGNRPTTKENGGKVAKAQWGGITTGNERTNSNHRGQYWEDLTINPEFGRTYRLTIPGWGINEKMIRHEGPNGTTIKSRYSLMSEPRVRWVNITTPNSDDYEWKNFYSNHMKKNIPQKLSNAQRLVPPMYDVKK